MTSKTETTSNLVLVSHHLCPYVQRAAISLAEKDAPFERIMIDLSAKTDWFKKMSPLGKVPLLLVQNDGDLVPIFESNAILEYLEESQPHPLHPADPLQRARHRAWIEFGSAILNGIARLYSAPNKTDVRREADVLGTMFSRIETELGSHSREQGQWFAGPQFSLVDAVFAPVFRYFDVFDPIGDFGILSEKPRIARWREALSQRPSVTSAVSEDYPERLRVFLRAKPSQLGTLAKALEAV